ncbi:MAG: pilin [Patescibacteria group bacterium]
MKRLRVLAVLLFGALVPYIAAAQVTLTNPLGTTDVRVIIGRVISGVLAISGTIALVMFIYGGLIWMTANGRQENIDKGKRVLTWAILGIVVITSAYVITNTIFQALLTPEVLTNPTP